MTDSLCVTNQARFFWWRSWFSYSPYLLSNTKPNKQEPSLATKLQSATLHLIKSVFIFDRLLSMMTVGFSKVGVDLDDGITLSNHFNDLNNGSWMPVRRCQYGLASCFEPSSIGGECQWCQARRFHPNNKQRHNRAPDWIPHSVILVVLRAPRQTILSFSEDLFVLPMHWILMGFAPLGRTPAVSKSALLMEPVARKIYVLIFQTGDGFDIWNYVHERFTGQTG